MKNLTKGIGLILILALSAAAQVAQPDQSLPAWDSTPGVGSGWPGVSPPATPLHQQPSPTLLPPTPGPVGETGSFNSVAISLTSGPVNLGSGDLLDISVFDSPELATRVRVGSNGEITFPLIGKLAIAGMTPLQVQDLIRQRLILENLVKDPQVSVFVSEFANQAVFILGEVTRPGAYPLIGSHRLFDLISEAGGFTARAGRSIIITRRAAPQMPENIRFVRDPDFSAGNPAIDAGDTVYVRRAGVFYVVGDVIKPGGFLMDAEDEVSVMQALATAEGTKPTAALGSVRLLRKTGQGRVETTINIKQIVRSEGAEPALHDQDILYVPRSAAKVAVESFLTYGVAAAVGAAIYRF